MFGISGMELTCILVFGFLLFGPDKMPQMGRTIGRALRQFRETQEKLTAVVQTEVVDPMAAAATGAMESKPKSSKQGSAQDEDADVDRDAPERKETFAERRARLAAEREAAQKNAEDANAADDAVAGSDKPSDEANATTDGAATEAASSADEPTDSSPANAEDEETAKVKATEALYARRPKRESKAATAKDVATDAAKEAMSDADKEGDE